MVFDDNDYPRTQRGSSIWHIRSVGQDGGDKNRAHKTDGRSRDRCHSAMLGAAAAARQRITLATLLCVVGTPPWAGSTADGAIRVLAYPRSSHVPIIHPATEDDDRPEVPDMMACLRAMSYTCVQRKTAVYLDTLNRRDRIRLLGDFITAVRVRPVDAEAPAITERLLDARSFNSIWSLSVLVDSVFRSIVQDHVIKISFPWIAGLGVPAYGSPDRPAAEEPVVNE